MSFSVKKIYYACLFLFENIFCLKEYTMRFYFGNCSHDILRFDEMSKNGLKFLFHIRLSLNGNRIKNSISHTMSE